MSAVAPHSVSALSQKKLIRVPTQKKKVQEIKHCKKLKKRKRTKNLEMKMTTETITMSTLEVLVRKTIMYCRVSRQTYGKYRGYNTLQMVQVQVKQTCLRRENHTCKKVL